MAIEFNGAVANGKTRPCRLTCEAADGSCVEVVAKFSFGCERGVTGLAMEMLGALLAHQLGLPVPEPLFVEISPEFARILPDTHRRLAQSSASLAFGSKLMTGGFATWPRHRAISDQLHSTALAIFVFDALAQNPDRRVANPNCLVRGDELRIIDHELCFMSADIIGWKAPWELGGINHMKSDDSHIFYSGLKGRAGSLAGGLASVHTAWSNIDGARLQICREALPPEWADGATALQNAVQLLRNARDNIDGFIEEVRRVLT